MNESELQRVNRMSGVREPLPSPHWEGFLELDDDPCSHLERILGVVRQLVEQPSPTWPSDVYWEQALPDWLRGHMLTPEAADKLMATTPRNEWDSLGWELGSWLEAMRDRDWAWWGVDRIDRQARIVVEMTGIPPRIDALKQVFLASGARISHERWT